MESVQLTYEDYKCRVVKKMTFEAFIHNDEVTCFHVVVLGTQKVIVMGRYNFKDEALTQR